MTCQKVGFREYLQHSGDPKLVLNLMVGDLQRLRIYAGTFQAPVEIPGPVWAVYERLAADGYRQFVLPNS